MSADDSLSADGLATETDRQALLQALVEMTRSVFAARACSIMSHDAGARELVFEAVAGEGAGTLVGGRIPANTGVAGWALASEEPLAIADVSKDPRFARDVAESTGYVPTNLSVYPLLHGERSLGVLSVLDQGISEQVGLADMNVLAGIANHAATVLALVLAARGAEAAGEGTGALAGVERALAAAPEGQREAALTLLGALQVMLEER
jgi:signal transduction protein with GAF and PtsI domain